MDYLLLSLVVQIALIVHALRTGRPFWWVFILLIAPGIGALAYFIIELLPELSGSMRTKRAVRNVRRTLDPDVDLRRKKLEHRLSGSVDATRHLADEFVDNGRYAEAIELYEETLTGLYEHDPNLMLGLARAQFGSDRHDKARATLEELKSRNPDFRSPDGHLLYARVLEADDDEQKALAEYEAVSAYYAGAEAKVRFGQLLEKLDQQEKALQQYEEIIASAELAPRHYRKAQRRWIREAVDGAKRLKG